MADYQKVETHEDAGDAAFSEADLQGLEQEAADQEAAQQAKLEEEAQREAQITAEERPEWLPEKFESPEAMAKAYSDLETEYTKKKQGEGGEEEEAATPTEFTLETFNKYSEEFGSSGEISDASRDELVKMGLPREMIDGYIEGQQALLSNHLNSVYAEVGGEGNYASMVEWAKGNLSENDQAVFNEAVMSGTPEQMMFAIRSLASRWTAEEPMSTQGSLIQGDTGTQGASGAFQSVAQLTAAMKDPRYIKDPAYRKDIETRLSHSNIL